MTQQIIHLSSDNCQFPPCNLALTNPDGLLAVGGCLSLTRLRTAYSKGIFPWFNEREPIMWWSPSERGVIELDEFHISKSLRKAMRRIKPKVTINRAFSDVITACRTQRLNSEGTWINSQILQAYMDAHHAGFAHSLELWNEEHLIGGLYGIMQSGVFCGESMFFNQPNASKLAMWALVNWLKRHNAHFIDCQLENPYLNTLGAKVIPRTEFLTKLNKANAFDMPANMWLTQTLENIYD
ncbi:MULTISPECIES: leucyl/phenylalanyl-tRNA--protein transferase [Pseudoalteromonas]|uniref:Leucyl/phenylalanyl-tRNA--protein transferase n=1 Tax=Pseudoalteromonas aurantia 208 TaxID=1314867 RepID=A0ABR9EBV0_9GAMM|nr:MULTISPECIES: leucyl/phenylalanyl-tRNA--protein transferase [Pseudoalteromonas]MBE0368453.1 leucyl/phenylalanyl-tRNA--protein transferase [Pseudoalteromonas aurantia 208]MBQ4847757.1 leucyl/phenylalanyl-tRNA--protein transferase [Pseudoalteromonas sp. MMG005]